jgi:hypothetical protein
MFSQPDVRFQFTLPYSMLSDPKRVLIERLGVKNVEKNSTTRSHFVFEKGTGKLLDAQIGIKADERCVKSSRCILTHHLHVDYSHEIVLAFLRRLAG